MENQMIAWKGGARPVGALVTVEVEYDNGDRHTDHAAAFNWSNVNKSIVGYRVVQNEGWIEWNGGENPAPGQIVEVKYRGYPGSEKRVSHFVSWAHKGAFGEVVAYRTADAAEVGRAIANMAENTSEPSRDGWIEWTGGNCPVDPDALVQVRMRDGSEVTRSAISHQGWGRKRGSTSVDPIRPRGQDIVAYRVLKQASEWIKWEGGVMPVHGLTSVFIRSKAGIEYEGSAHSFNWAGEGNSRSQVGEYVVMSEYKPDSSEAETEVLTLRIDASPLSRVLKRFAEMTDPAFGAEESPKQAMTAPALLEQASKHMADRAATYDQPAGERSMEATVEAFNAITGRDLRESEGWLLMELLKLVRSEAAPAPHRDSIEDAVSYTALYGEAKLQELAK